MLKPVTVLLVHPQEPCLLDSEQAVLEATFLLLATKNKILGHTRQWHNHKVGNKIMREKSQHLIYIIYEEFHVMEFYWM